MSPDSYIVAMDGIMEQLVGAPRTGPDWGWNNPRQAVREFLERTAEFVLEEPAFPFNEGVVADRVTLAGRVPQAGRVSRTLISVLGRPRGRRPG